MGQIQIQFRPIVGWPHKARSPKPSAFKASYGQTLSLLDRELWYLRARNVVIQLDLQERDIRNDGLPRSDSRPRSPRVILAFDSVHGALKYYGDVFNDWQDNLRAIALGLECLRTVDRYGITRRGEQYTGWKALPGAIAVEPEMTREEAMRVIVCRTAYSFDEVAKDATIAKAAYREACFKTHPDHGGNSEAFHRVQQAWEVLEKHIPA